MKRPTKALYAGSFDPVTYGHLDIIEKSFKTFDQVHVGVGVNPKKTGLFTPEERVKLITKACQPLEDRFESEAEFKESFSAGSFQGSVIEYAKKIGATHIVRGLRQVSDFNDEFTYHGVLQRMAPGFPVVHLICEHLYLHVSSSTARELAALNEDLNWLVPKNVEKALRKKFK